MFIYRMGIIMKHNIIQFKKFKIDTYIQKVYNGFEFTPIEICKFKMSNNNYITIRISLIKIYICIEFIWNGEK